MDGVLVGIGSEPRGQDGLNEGMDESRSGERFVRVFSARVFGLVVVVVIGGQIGRRVVVVIIVGFVGFATIFFFLGGEAGIVGDGVEEGV